MLDSSSGASRDDGRLVHFVLCQLATVAVVLAISLLTAPVHAPYVTIGALAVVLPSSVITLIMRNANPGALVMFAMLRAFVIAFAVICAFLLFKPAMMPYLIGAGLGIVVMTFVPIALTLLRPTRVSDSTSA